MRKVYVTPAFIKAQSLSAITAAPPPPVVSGAAPVT